MKTVVFSSSSGCDGTLMVELNSMITNPSKVIFLILADIWSVLLFVGKGAWLKLGVTFISSFNFVNELKF